MRLTTLGLMLLTLPLAGCSGGDDAGGSSSSASSGSSSDGGSASASASTSDASGTGTDSATGSTSEGSTSASTSEGSTSASTSEGSTSQGSTSDGSTSASTSDGSTSQGSTSDDSTTGGGMVCHHSEGPWYQGGAEQDPIGGCMQACKNASGCDLQVEMLDVSDPCQQICNLACPINQDSNDRECCDVSFCESDNWCLKLLGMGKREACYTGDAQCSPLVCAKN